jgi:glycosyltransferase involved in cell wall biosynthesis
MTGVCLITTVLQEGDGIAELMDSILAQTHPPQRVVVADGGSTDRTVDILRRYENRLPLTVIVIPGGNRSRGRNAGAEACDEPVIACVDAGCVLEPAWVETISRPMLERSDVEVVAGYYEPEPRTVMERAAAAALVPRPEEVDPHTFLPSSRSIAFRREAWERAGRYPEWTPFNEDTVFDVALKRTGARFVFEPRAIVHWRPQGRPARIFRQFFRYARGDGLSGLWFGHYGKAYAELIVAGVVVWLAAAYAPAWLWALVPLAGLYWLRVARRARRRGAGTAAALLAPVAMAIVDAAHVCGYTIGIVNRLALAGIGRAPVIGRPDG